MATRPLLWLTLAYVTGVTAGHLLRPPPQAPLLLGLAAVGASVAAGTRAFRPSAALARWLATATLMAGCLAGASAWDRLIPWEGRAPVGGGAPPPSRWVVVEGRVFSEPKPTATGYSFVLKAADGGPYWRDGERVYVLIRETTRPPEAGRLFPCPGGGAPVPGQSVRLMGLLSCPDPPGNPGEFDFRLYLAARGIRYTLSTRVRPYVLPDSPETLTARLTAACRTARESLLRGLHDSLPPVEASLLAGLLFGDTSGLPADVVADFRRSGVFHILAVSGSNVAFVAGGFWLVARPLLGLAGMRGRRGDAVVWPATAVVLAAYAVMAGLGPSVVRATLMAEVGLVYLWLGRRRDLTAPLCLAALAVLARAPLTILDVGFQLSFAATVGLLGLYPALRRHVLDRLPTPTPGVAGKVSRRSPVRRVLRAGLEAALVSLAAQAAVWPVLAWHFGEVSLAGLVANALAVPLSGLAVTAGLGAGMVAMAGTAGALVSLPLLWFTAAVLKSMLGIARVFAGLPAASVVTGRPPLWVVVLYYLGLAWVLRGASSGRAGRRAALCLCVALALTAGNLTAETLAGPAGRADVVFLDVGQGDCAVLRLPGREVFLVDGGPPGAGERVLGPYLRNARVSHIRAVFVSHLHDDHVGGLVELLRDPALRIDEIVFREGFRDAEAGPLVRSLLEAAGTAGVPLREVASGASLGPAEGSTVIEVLWPPPAGQSGRAPAGPGESPGSSGENDLSLVLRVSVGQVAFLLPGDLEEAEAELLRSLVPAKPGTDESHPVSGVLTATVLKVSHHGSAYSTSGRFLSRVRPAVCAVSVGPNSFGHPSPGTVGRLAASGALVFTTDEDGAVTVTVAGREVAVRTFLSGKRILLIVTPAGAPAARGSGPAG